MRVLVCVGVLCVIHHCSVPSFLQPNPPVEKMSTMANRAVMKIPFLDVVGLKLEKEAY